MSQEKEKPKLILIADSEARTMQVQRLKDLLQREGFLVQIKSDGFLALMWLEENAPDLILIDLGLPRLDGLSFLKVIRYLGKNYFPELKRIAIMATANSSDRRLMSEAVSAGAKYFINKPWQITDLMQKIRKALHSDSLAVR